MIQFLRMFKIRHLWIFALSTGLAVSLEAAGLPAPSPSPSPAPRYSQGDQAFLQRGDSSRAREAFRLFREYHQQNPGDPEAAWRHAMGCYFAGLHLAANDEERESWFAEGCEAGLAGIALKPDCAPCHFWTAINMALYGQTVGVFKMFFTLGKIREHLEQTAKLDPAYAGAGSYRLLGLVEQKLPGILGGSNDSAKRYFQKAIEIAPDEQLNYLFMAKLLAEKFDDLPGAVTAARQGIARPKPRPEQVESAGALRELEKFVRDHAQPDAAPSPSASPSASPSPSVPSRRPR